MLNFFCKILQHPKINPGSAPGGGRKLTDVELEEEVLSLMQQRRSNMLRISRKFIMFKAKSIYSEKCGDNEELKAAFVASNGWLTKFMKRSNLSMQRQT